MVAKWLALHAFLPTRLYSSSIVTCSTPLWLCNSKTTARHWKLWDIYVFLKGFLEITGKSWIIEMVSSNGAPIPRAKVHHYTQDCQHWRGIFIPDTPQKANLAIEHLYFRQEMTSSIIDKWLSFHCHVCFLGRPINLQTVSKCDFHFSFPRRIHASTHWEVFRRSDRSGNRGKAMEIIMERQ